MIKQILKGEIITMIVGFITYIEVKYNIRTKIGGGINANILLQGSYIICEVI